MLTFNTILVVLIALQRLVELSISKRHQKTLAACGSHPVRDAVFPWMVATHVLLLLGCILEPIFLQRQFAPVIAWPALGLLVACQVARVWVLRTLGRHWNVRIIASGSGGVVTRGPYRFVRHPNYAVVLVEALVLPLFHGAYLTLVVVQLLHLPVLIARIRAEESYLLSLPDYRERMADKPRFVPRVWSRARKRRAQ